MVVIGHDAVVQAFNLELLYDVSEQVHELTVVHMVKEYGHATVSA